MQAYLEGILREKINKKFRNIPVVAILGPWKCGKSTLIKSPEKGFWNVINDPSSWWKEGVKSDGYSQSMVHGFFITGRRLLIYRGVLN